MNEITERWEKTGLLEGFDDFNKNECASSLQNVAKLLTGELNGYRKEVDSKTDEGFFDETILLIVRRLYDECPEKVSSTSLKWVVEDFGEFAKKHHLLYKDLNNHISMDGAAELVAVYM